MIVNTRGEIAKLDLDGGVFVCWWGRDLWRAGLLGLDRVIGGGFGLILWNFEVLID